MESLGVSVPCYNESGNIPAIVDKFGEIVDRHDFVKVVLVDNGSSDGSTELLNQLLEDKGNPRLTTYRIEKNIGYGNGILKGLECLETDFLSWTHADLQTDPEDVIKGFQLFLNNQQKNFIVKGERKNRKWLEAFFTFGMQIISFFALRTYLSDINAQPKIFSRSFYNQYVKIDAPLDFSLDLYLLYQAKKNGFHIKTIPVFFKDRLHGEAKGGGSWKGRIKLIRRTLAYIFELAGRYN